MRAAIFEKGVCCDLVRLTAEVTSSNVRNIWDIIDLSVMKYVVKNTNRSLSSTIFTLVFIIIYKFQNQFHSMNAFVFQVTSSETHRDTNQSRMHIDVPQDQLSLMIRLCLTDSNFPAFVKAVEKELTNLTSSEQI